jgi:hypothetical protein
MRWGILFGVLVMLAGCAGKSESDDDAGGSGNDAGKGGSDGNGKGGSGATSSGGSSASGGTSGGTLGGSGTSVGGTSAGGTSAGGTSGAAGEPAGGSAGSGVEPECTALTTAEAPTVELAFSTDGTPPSPAGGTVQSGTYYLAQETFYGASAECQSLGASYQDLAIGLVEVVRFIPQTSTSGALEIALEVTASGVEPTRATGAGTYSTSGSSMTVSGTCGGVNDGSSEASDYTAAGEELVLFSNTNASCDVTVAVFRKL